MADQPDVGKVDVNKIISDLRSHTFNMSLLNVLVLVVALVVVGGLWLHSVQRFDQLMARADAQNTEYRKDLADSEAQWKSDQQAILALQTQKTAVQTKIVYRDRQVASQVATVTNPDRTSEQVTQDVVSAYKFAPVSVIGEDFTFSRLQTQTFVATLLDRDRLAGDLEDTKNQLALETQATVIATTDTQIAQKRLDEANGVINNYKKLAKKSKFKTFLGAAEKVAIFVGGVYLGKKI